MHGLECDPAGHRAVADHRDRVAVLAVPVAALSMASDGTTRVQVQPPRAPVRWGTVEPGLAAKGLVAVTPLQGDLGPGDPVVVGATQAKARGAGSGNGK